MQGIRGGIKYQNQAKHYILAQFRTVRCVAEIGYPKRAFERSSGHDSQPSYSVSVEQVANQCVQEEVIDLKHQQEKLMWWTKKTACRVMLVNGSINFMLVRRT